MPELIEAAWLRRFAVKVGISNPRPEDVDLINELLSLMQTDGADFTNTFRALGTEQARDQFTNRDAFDTWAESWRARIEDESNAQAVMRAANPAVIPRNHRIEQMIEAAIAGDMAPFERLMKALSTPFDETDPELQRPPTEDEIVPATFCGT
jgi:uncharacterized protein YdiU (UPF0061 family)